MDSGRTPRGGGRARRGREPLVPTHYFENLADFATGRGSDRGRLFARAKLDAAKVKAAGFVTFSEFRALMLATATEARAPSFALELGCALSPASHGALGLAALAAEDLRESLGTLVRYIRTRTPLVRVEQHSREGVVFVRLTDAIVMGDVRRHVHELVVSTLVTALRALTGGRYRASEVRFSFPAPGDVPLYERLLVAPVVFDAQVTEIRFPAVHLDLAVVLADRTAARLAVEQLEAELHALEDRMDLRDRVRERLLRERGTLPSIERVARDLHTTERTLRRHLAGLGTSFHDIVQTTRAELAVHYLRDTELPIHEIADRLGYSDPSNFGAAFRAWTKTSPRAYRKKLARRG